MGVDCDESAHICGEVIDNSIRWMEFYRHMFAQSKIYADG